MTDFLFVGDNTTTADGAFAWSYMEVLVPEPGSALLFAAGLAMVARWRRRAA